MENFGRPPLFRWLASLAAALCVASSFRDSLVHAEDAKPGSAKAQWIAEKEAEDARQVWGPQLEARIQGWRVVDRFQEVRAAVDEALERFPDPQSVALVVGAVRFINTGNVKWDARAAGVDAWNSEVAHRALASLPRPPRIDDHSVLVQRGVLAGWRASRSESQADDEGEVRQDLAILARFLRRLLDDEERLWSPLPKPDFDMRYAPVRRTDPRWSTQGPVNVPTDEEAFLEYEEAWYANALRSSELWMLRDIRRSYWSHPEVVSAFVSRFPADSPAEAAFRERMLKEVPELPWLSLLDATRRAHAGMPMRSVPGVSFWVTGRRASMSPTSGQVGINLAVEVFVMNRTDATKVIPLGRVRAAVIHGENPRDDEALPPPRAPLPADLVIVAPNHTASVPLSLPMLRDGLARIVVALDNEAGAIGDTEGVWTGAERCVTYIDVRARDASPSPKLTRGAWESAKHPERVDGLVAQIETLGREQPDDGGAETCGKVAVKATDGRVAGAALAVVEAALARGCGTSSYGSLATIAADRERPRELRLRAVDGLARLATGRMPGRFVAGPQVQVVLDVPVPPRIRAHVRERLETLARDSDVLVAERARAALAH